MDILDEETEVENDSEKALRLMRRSREVLTINNLGLDSIPLILRSGAAAPVVDTKANRHARSRGV